MKKWIACVMIGTIISLTLLGCKKTKTGEEKGTPTPTGTITNPVTPNTEKEAKLLSDKVKTGQLLELSERLPKEADVCVEALPSEGYYGENAALAVMDVTEAAGELFSEPLFRYSADGKIIPNVASSYTVNSSFTEYIINLREGMHWSDGEKFSAGDCIFFYEKLCLSEAFAEPLWNCFQVKGADGETTKAKFEKISSTSFRVTFSSSKPEFLSELLAAGGVCYAPKHYFINILPEYITEKSALSKIKEMGYTSLPDFLKLAVKKPFEVYKLPTLSPYVCATSETKNDSAGSSINFLRNPYYWKTDKSGRQLPYLDSISFTKITGEDQGILLVKEGYLTVHALNAEQKREVEGAEEQGDFHIVSYGDSLFYAVKNSLYNFTEQYSSKDKEIRGFGVTNVIGWYYK